MATQEVKNDYAPSADSGSHHVDEEKGLAGAREDRLSENRSTDPELNAPPKPDTQPAQKPGGPGPPPNGGLTAWLQVLAGWTLFFNTWGMLNTFGVYQTYYESGQLFTESSSTIAWIGSIQALCVLFVGAVVGPIYDRGYLRSLLLVGSFGVVFGHMMLSLCKTYWEVLLAQGLCIGMGAGCLFIPAVAILPTYFSTRIGTAIGIAATGSSMGGIIYPIMLYKLVGEVGFPWAVRIIGFLALATLILPILIMKMRVKPPKIRSIIDWSAFTDVPYMTFIVGGIIGFIGLYVGIFYLSYFGEITGLTDESLSFYLVPILNAGSVLGRSLPNYIGDKIGPTNVIIPGSAMVGVLLLCLLAVSNAGGLIAITVLFGFFSGIFIAMPPVIIVALTKDKSKIGTRIGMGFAMMGAGVLAGGPGGGGILGNDPRNLHWTGTWVYGGVCTIASAVIFAIVRFMLVGPKLKAKV